MWLLTATHKLGNEPVHVHVYSGVWWLTLLQCYHSQLVYLLCSNYVYLGIGIALFNVPGTAISKGQFIRGNLELDLVLTSLHQ